MLSFPKTSPDTTKNCLCIKAAPKAPESVFVVGESRSLPHFGHPVLRRANGTKNRSPFSTVAWFGSRFSCKHTKKQHTSPLLERAAETSSFCTVQHQGRNTALCCVCVRTSLTSHRSAHGFALKSRTQLVLLPLGSTHCCQKNDD